MPRLYLLNPQSISILQDRFMVKFVSCDDIGERSDANFDIVGNSSSLPSFRLQIPKQRNGGAAHLLEFASQIAHSPLVEAAVLYVVILLEARDWSPIIARDSQRAVGHDALGIDQMAEHFFNAPLVRLIAKCAVMLRKAAK